MESDDRTVFPVRDGTAVLRRHGIDVSESRVYQMIREGQINALHVGRRIYIPRRELERLCGLEVAA